MNSPRPSMSQYPAPPKLEVPRSPYMPPQASPWASAPSAPAGPPPPGYGPGQPYPFAQNQQPQAMPAMSIAGTGGGNRNALNKPMGHDGRDWSHGICGCCDDCGTCMLAWCVPCIQYGRNKQRYTHLHQHGVPHPDGGGFANEDCLFHLGLSLCGMQWVMQMMTRGEIRKRYTIKGGGCGDCCTAVWCAPCALVQESQELQLEEDSFQMRTLH